MSSELLTLGRRNLGMLGVGLAAAASGLRTIPGLTRQAAAATPDAGAPIKVGILHSLSGTMAISETTLKDVMLMLIDEQNKKGGLMGRKLEAVVVDPASNWPLFAEKARQLLSVDKVAAVFGCRCTPRHKNPSNCSASFSPILWERRTEGDTSSPALSNALRCV